MTAAPLTRWGRGSYGLGVLFLLLAGAALSSGGYLVRAIEDADGWQILFYRGLGFTITSFLFTLIYNKGKFVGPFKAIGWPGVIAALALGLGFGTYLFAVLMTTVANVVVILSLGPFAAALLGWIFLKEPVARLTWGAMLAALAGIALMMADGIKGGGALGIGIALFAPLLFAIMVVAVRKRAHQDMTPLLPLAGLIATLIGFAMMESFAISGGDLFHALALGAFQIGIGFILITLGARTVPAAQIPLFALTETVLSPIWVWFAFNEVPAPLALIGATVVLAAVAAEAYRGLRLEGR